MLNILVLVHLNVIVLLIYLTVLYVEGLTSGYLVRVSFLCILDASICFAGPEHCITFCQLLWPPPCGTGSAGQRGQCEGTK